jgi:hypothetical protein
MGLRRRGRTRPPATLAAAPRSVPSTPRVRYVNPQPSTQPRRMKLAPFNGSVNGRAGQIGEPSHLCRTQHRACSGSSRKVVHFQPSSLLVEGWLETNLPPAVCANFADMCGATPDPEDPPHPATRAEPARVNARYFVGVFDGRVALWMVRRVASRRGLGSMLKPMATMRTASARPRGQCVGRSTLATDRHGVSR